MSGMKLDGGDANNLGLVAKNLGLDSKILQVHEHIVRYLHPTPLLDPQSLYPPPPHKKNPTVKRRKAWAHPDLSVSLQGLISSKQMSSHSKHILKVNFVLLELWPE